MSIPWRAVGVERLPFVLQRRMHRRHLRDAADEAGAGALDIAARDRDRPRCGRSRLRHRPSSSSCRARAWRGSACRRRGSPARTSSPRRSTAAADRRRERVERAGLWPALFGPQQVARVAAARRCSTRRGLCRAAARPCTGPAHDARVAQGSRKRPRSVVLGARRVRTARSAPSARRRARWCGPNLKCNVGTVWMCSFLNRLLRMKPAASFNAVSHSGGIADQHREEDRRACA